MTRRVPRRLGRIASRPAAVFGFILATGVALRLFHLSYQSLWIDEIFSAAQSGRTVAAVIEAIRHDYHPPLYFVMLDLWTGIAGSSEAALRLPSVFAGAVGIWAVFRAARRLTTRAGAWIATWLFAVGLMPIHYAQEARSYAWLAALAPVSIACLVDWLQTSRRRHLAALAGISVVLLYTHYFAAFFLLAENLFMGAWMIARWRTRRAAGERQADRTMTGSWIVAQLVVAVCFVPWLPTFMAQMQTVRDGYWMRTATVELLIRTGLMFLGAARPPMGGLTLAGSMFAAAVLALTAGAVLHARPAIRRTAAASGGAIADPVSRPLTSGWSFALLAFWLLTPTIVPWIFAHGSLRIFMPRNTIISVGAAMILLGDVAARLTAARRTALVVMLTLPSVCNYPWYYFSPHKEQWRDVAAWIGGRSRPGDAVVIDEPYQWMSLTSYYAPGLAGAPVDPVDLPAHAGRVWLVTSPTLGDARHRREATLEAAIGARGFHRVTGARFTDVDVFLFEP